MSFSNGLTPGEAERLALLAEECGEAIQAIGKILRHGYRSVHPEGRDEGRTNRQNLQREIGDIECAITMLCQAGDIDKHGVMSAARDKWKRLRKYLHHQEPQAAKTLDCGCNTGPCTDSGETKP